MSLRWRVALAILALVLAAVAASGMLASRRVVDPLARQVRGAFADQAVYVAERWAAGDPPERLEAAFGVRVRPVDAPPAAAPSGAPARRVRRAGRPLVVVPDRGPDIYVETRAGWVAVAHELDLDRPGRRLLTVFGLAGIGFALVAAGIGAAATRPLGLTRRALEEVAAGDLSHRLDERGPAELVAVARAFNAMAGRIEGLLRTERELLAGVSHELRTPLTRLRLALELLRDDGAPVRRVDAMEADLNELDALIGDLLALSRLQLGDEVLRRAPLDLCEVAGEVVAAAADPRVSLRGEAAPVEADAALVRRAVDNLVRNALRHAPDGPVEVVVGPAAVEVLDRGPGVPSVALERLFDPFYRVDASRSRQGGGVGLGLMIVRQVAELHGGRASARLREGGGLAVRLELGPVRPG